MELTRLRWRRAVLLLLVGAVVLPALLLAGTAWNTRPVSEADVDAILSDRYAREEVDRCERRPERYLGDAEVADASACRALVAGWYGGRSPLDVAGERTGTLVAASTVVLLLLLLLGTTFVGHDWNTGSMSNQLLFEPRRVRVWATKATAVTLLALLVAAAVLAAYWTGLLALASARDLAVPDAVRTDGYQQVGRTAVLAGGTALGGFALTMLFRSTVATVGVVFALAVASGALLGIIGEGSGRWTPPLNVLAVVQGGTTYYDESSLPPECFTGRGVPDGGCDGTQVITAADGGVYLGSFLALAVAGSVASFRRRDVP